jgi:hypothetical protein
MLDIVINCVILSIQDNLNMLINVAVLFEHSLASTFAASPQPRKSPPAAAPATPVSPPLSLPATAPISARPQSPKRTAL